MRVYIVVRGEQHEGGSVMGAYSSYDKARYAALGSKPSFGPWEEDPDEPDYWESGCDFVTVQDWEVE